MYGYCEEKIEVGHHWDLKGKVNSVSVELIAWCLYGPLPKHKTLLYG